MVTFLTFGMKEIEKRETLRYLGYPSNIEELPPLYEECERAVLGVLSPKCCFDIFSVETEHDTVTFPFVKCHSHSLYLNLNGCDNAVAFAATLGLELDRLIQKYSKINPAKAVIMQAMATAAMETLCDAVCREIAEKYGKIRPRFSCGYGDCPIEMQKDIFRALQVTKNIGITLTDANLMIPTKSVTAFVGIE